MCYSGTCGQPSCRTCYPCDPCSFSSDCPLQLDFSCVIYHKNNADISELSALALGNGSTLELVVEEIDKKLADFNFISFSLPILRQTYVINSLKQFAEAIDVELNDIRSDISALSSTPSLVANDSATVDFTTSGVQGHTITASVKVSGTAGNRIAENPDGLYVGPQTLVPNYTTKELGIAGGNTISLASMASGVQGYLGNVTSDPAAIDGQYWFNTTTNQLKIKTNGIVRVITTS